MKYRYQKADEYVIFNDVEDKDLKPIKYLLPTAPPPEDIYGYGLPPEQQKWVRFPMPKKLAELEKEPLTSSQKQQHIERNASYYEDEIKYIKTEIKRSQEGFWLFINGKATFLTNHHYFYLQNWERKDEYPAYRDRDRKSWLFMKMVEEDDTCLGYNYPKHRREGATTRASAWRYHRTISGRNHRAGLQSKDAGHAKSVHLFHVKEVWKTMPFWFKPIDDGKEDIVDNVIKFYSPGFKTHPDYKKKSLKSLIDFKDSGVKGYDGEEENSLHNDECGKTEEVDVLERWDTQKHCLTRGSLVIGKCVNTSTVDEMLKGGGRSFKKLCYQSFHQDRNANGRTQSGLYNLFIPASEGLEGVDKETGLSFIDEYGSSRKELAEKWILAERKALWDAGEYESYIKLCRELPLEWKDCWKTEATECFFNLGIIETVLDKYRNGNIEKVRGDFKWVNDIADGTVEWIPSNEGRFYISYQFPDPARQANKYIYKDGLRIPTNTHKFIAGADPMKADNKNVRDKNRWSYGGGAGFLKFDPNTDSRDRDVSTWQTHRFFWTYLHRPSTVDEYVDDMIKACVYWGCQINSESNIPVVIQGFERRGYGGYLYYGIKDNGQADVIPGMHTGTTQIQRIIRLYHTYIQNHGLQEKHEEILEQCRDFDGNMGDYDLFVAGGEALCAVNDDFFNVATTDETDIEEYFAPTYYN